MNSESTAIGIGSLESKPTQDGSLSANQIFKNTEQLRSERLTTETLWQECADYFMPSKNTITVRRSQGEKRNLVLLDNTGIVSLETLASALHSFLTNPNSKWLDFTTGDADIDNRDDVRLYFEKTASVVLNILGNSNFYGEAHEYTLDLCGFGTAAMDIEEDPETTVRFLTRFIKDIFIKENVFGMIGEYYRCFQATAHELVMLFGDKDLPEQVRKAYQDGTNKKFECVHAIYEKRKANPGVLKLWSQYAVKLTSKDSWEASKKGFRQWPAAVSRFSKKSGEVYGSCPAQNALPDMKTLNKMTETVLKGAEKVVDPPVQMPDDGFIGHLETTPGGVNYYRAGSNDRVEPIFNDSRVDFGFDALKERRERIRESFFIDQLKLREADRMTTVEVQQRTEEGARLLAAFLSRQRIEFLSVVAERVLFIAEKKGLLPNAPEALLKTGFSAKYSSLIAKSQVVEQIQGIFRTMEAIAPFASFDPGVTDNFDSDEAVRFVAKALGFPQKIIRETKARDAIREARAEAQAEAENQQAQLSQAETVGKVAPALAALNKVQGTF